MQNSCVLKCVSFLFVFVIFPLHSVTVSDAIKKPELLIKKDVSIPVFEKRPKHYSLSLHDAIILSLRYNPLIQQSELDRIVERYDLRLAYREFELQYALSGAAAIERTTFQGIGSTSVQSAIASPEVSLKTRFGTQVSFKLENSLSLYDNLIPVLNFSLTQPLLKGAGFQANEIGLLNALDQERLRRAMKKQVMMDQLTEVIFAFRTLILAERHLKIEHQGLLDAKHLYEMNQKKIKIGELAPAVNIQQAYQIESLKLLLLQAENDKRMAHQHLLEVIGLPSEMKVTLIPEDEKIQKSRTSLAFAIETALAKNTRYFAQKMMLRADERTLKAAKNTRLWQLDAGVSWQTGIVTEVGENAPVADIYKGRNTNEQARLTLHVPIQNLEANHALIRAKVAREKDRIALLSTERLLKTEVTNLVMNIKSTEKEVELAKKRAHFAKKAYALEKKKQNAGMSGALEVSQAQNQTLQAELLLSAAKIRYLNQETALHRLLGTTLDVWKLHLKGEDV